MKEDILLTPEEIELKGLLTEREIKIAIESASAFDKENPDVPEAFNLKFKELCRANSGEKVAHAAALKAVNKELDDLHEIIWMTPPEGRSDKLLAHYKSLESLIKELEDGTVHTQ